MPDPVDYAPSQWKTQRRAWRWPEWLLAGYWMTLAAATHYPRMPGIAVPGKDRTLHFVAYAILTWLLLNVLARRRRMGALAVTGVALLIAAAYGVVDELTQPYTGRQADVVDWLMDVAGALTVAGVYLATARTARR